MNLYLKFTPKQVIRRIKTEQIAKNLTETNCKVRAKRDLTFR